MKRRSFLGASLATLGSAASVEAAEGTMGEIYELRTWRLNEKKKPELAQPVLDHYLSKAFIPALKRHGIGPIGAFLEPGSPRGGQPRVEGPPTIYSLVVYPSAEKFITLPTQLAADEEYRKAAKDYLDIPASDPLYSRIESSLLVPIAGMPKLAKPDASKARLFNLRIYESHNERAASKKIEMFNKNELAIFRRTGLTPVFFAETVVGPAMPNLTYMLVFPDNAGREAAWKRFRDDAEWQKLRDTGVCGQGDRVESHEQDSDAAAVFGDLAVLLPRRRAPRGEFFRTTDPHSSDRTIRCALPTSPVSKPFLNQRMRCADVPCVKLSGTT